ncbi:MAG: hypothetical protein NT069_11445, partial [Planctomycetota bacterium]|nr:hypothetical protein [Planctomycetota bacterium]
MPVTRFAITLVVFTSVWFATRSADAQERVTFRQTLQARQRETVKVVADYIASHPEGDDADEARTWMFETVIAGGLEQEGLSVARACLERP